MNEIEREYGLNLPCFNCRNIKKCYIIVDSFDDEKSWRRSPNIICLSCETMISNARYKNHEQYNIIYKKIWRNINQRFNYIVSKLVYYIMYYEITNLSADQINLICFIIKIIVHNHYNLYGEKMRMISIHYILVKIFKLIGIDLGLSVNLPITHRYEVYFKTIFDYSYDDIFDLINEFY